MGAVLSMKRYISNCVVCPYYLHESKQMVDCIGIKDDTVIHLAFANATESLMYKKDNCKSNYTKCIIYKMLKQERGDYFC